MTEITNSQSPIVLKVELYTKLILGFTASCYAIGILVVNIFYGKYGFYSLSLFRINYVIAGFWAIIVLALIYLFFRILLKSFLSTFGKNKREKDWKRFLLLIAFSLSMLLWIPPSIASYLGIIIGWNWLFIALTGCIGLTFITKNIKSGSINWSIISSDTDTIFNVLFGLSLLVGYLVSFSTSLYPNIPANIGGGQPQKVQLVTPKSFEPYLFVQGVKFIDLYKDSTTTLHNEVTVTETLDLLLLTDTEIILTLQGTKEQSFSINRNANFIIHFVKDKTLK